MKRTVGRGLGAGLVLAFWPGQALACSVCYGEPDSPAAKGLTWAIVVLGGIVVGVLGAVVAFFVHANRGPDSNAG